jgi:hypothetical protein
MAKCSGITQAGTACKGIPIDGSQWCYVHHPEHTEERRRQGSKGGKRGGRGRPLVEVARLQERFEELANKVGNKEISRADALAMGQLLNFKLRAISVALDVREAEETVPQVEAIKDMLEAKRSDDQGDTQYG